VDVKIAAFSEAVEGFADLTALDLSNLAKTFDSRIIDGLENGQAQKFEYTTELCWKTIKASLRQREGIDGPSPKRDIKAWYLTGHLAEENYLNLVRARRHRRDLGGDPGR